MTRRDLERGSASPELAIIAPAALALLGLLLACAAIASTQQSVTTTAHASARAASLASNEQDATERVRSAFTSELQQRGLSCDSLSVDVDASAFSTTPGTTATIHSTISCTVPLTQIIPVPGLPGTKTITVDSSSPLDTYRERS